MADRESTDHHFGLPSASADDEARPRCRFCGGWISDDGSEQCDRCGLTVERVDELAVRHDEPGRYHVDEVLGDGVPYLRARARTLLDALVLEVALRVALKRKGYTQFFVGVTDSDDPERGWLAEDGWVEGVDAGPDPNAA
jgi:hypothetical protein